MKKYKILPGLDDWLAADGANFNLKNIAVVFSFIALVLGAAYAWGARNFMNPDGITYLDMGDAFFSGDWKTAINACWSPLYSLVLGASIHFLKPSLYWEFPAAHFANYLLYLFTLCCFHFFIYELILNQKNKKSRIFENADITIPEWALLALGYTLFIWSSLSLISLVVLTPDMFMAGFVYLAYGLLLRIGRKDNGWVSFAILGAVLGLGYLAKTVMFPISIILLAISFFLAQSRRRQILYLLTAIVFFVSIAGPFIFALSKAKRHFSIGESYNVVCSGFNCKGALIIAHWQGEPPCGGTPKHPTRKIFDKPNVFEFAEPIAGTYPPWYDPSYWNEGIISSFDLNERLNTIYSSAKAYFHLFLYDQECLIIAALILFFMSNRKKLWLREIKKYWFLLFPTILILVIYGFINVTTRYVGEFIIVLWLCIFSSIRLPKSQESKRLIAATLFSLILAIIIPMFVFAGNYLIKDAYPSFEIYPEVASTLKQMGIKPKDKVAIIGGAFYEYWARLLRVKIVAEIPKQEEVYFWMADDSLKSRIIKALTETGAKFIVGKLPGYAPTTGWKRIGNTDYYIFQGGPA